ncbi:AfsR/SARP family transcriptional regulator [Lentzea kentuckyensis]|uniref:AfsR/SARP family transcriptional regulator n=1 Tax=Lentzea kentuckyensis TaxID=360086 RepID=UPI000A3A5853|nr:BTAD domain-containing putative transcriptional regulator [Lentzea kentuckyensis]
MVELRVLGDVSAWIGDRRIEVGHARQRCVFAVLAVEANQVVTVDQLLERVWEQHLPYRSRQVVRTYLSRLRLLLSPEGIAIERRPSGYVLLAGTDVVDLHRFRHLIAAARAAGDDQALDLFDQALALWRGEPFAGLRTEWLATVRTGLEGERTAALLDRLDVALRCGRHAEVLPQLCALADNDVLDERVAGQLMLALHRSGHTADALARYRRLRERLVEELGSEPGSALQDLHQRILGADPALTRSSVVHTTAVPPLPRQLPVPPRWFTGRGTELARLDKALVAEPATVVISAIGGAGGIGKTWLALRWAHAHADRFPDGQLFVDLRGFTPVEQPVAPDAALFGFLTALGVTPDGVPVDLDARAALYRSLVAGRRMLVVLDNAATADQVTPLLPGSPGCTVLVTCRHRLASLIDRYGARHLRLDVLARAEGRALLDARLGTGRVAAEPGAVDELVELCGGYPLALSITARHAAARTGTCLAELAAELRELGLEMLDHDTDPAASLPAVLSWSLRRLSDEQRTMFGLLGIAPGSDTTLPAVAALTGLPAARARKTLAALEEASLVERRPHGRYAMHDLIRAFAALTANDLPEDVRSTALARVMDFHLHTAHAADRLLDSHRQLVPPDPPAPGVGPHPLPDAAAAMAWLEAEYATLLATQRAAAAAGRHQVVWHLAWCLETFHHRRGYGRESLVFWRAALDAAAHLPGPARTSARRNLGNACSRLGLHEEATEHLCQALDLAVRRDDPTEQAHAHRTLASVWSDRGDDRRALDHARQALGLYRALGLPVREADSLSQTAWYAARLGDFDTARDDCRAALGLHRKHHNRSGEAATLDSLGFIAHRTGDHAEAVELYDEALALYRTLGHTSMAAETLDNLGHPHAALGQREQARAAWQEALGLYREHGRDGDAERVRRQLDELVAPQPVRTRDQFGHY